MAYRVRAVRDVEEYRAAVGAIGHYFGWTPTVDDVERFSSLLRHYTKDYKSSKAKPWF